MFVPCAQLFGFEPHYHLDESNAQDIGQVPLLKLEEEKAIFEELQIRKTLFGKILSKLQIFAS
jgi:DNA-directed RNA polymerase subunit H (RpoH/RPB5)